ncbi:MAG: phospho-N-acetylmuramoyl-pentapeptide-transferase [Deltaproteobacteria bacterium]|nr:phospho-N-acetylmuramoyl-pentapeptide-transferase [Deltaproteobacteria bacterium]
MFYQFLYPLHTLFSGFNVFRYITFRCAGAAITAFLIMLFMNPGFIKFLRKNGIGQVIRTDGPESHLTKEGVPTMGGVLVIFAIIMTTLLWVNLLNRHIWIILFITLWFAVIGGYDDWRKIKKRNSKGLSPRGKMVLQIIGALITGFFIYRDPAVNEALVLPFFKNFSFNMGWGYIAFIVLVIVGASNAVNLTDGLDGLVTGPTVITAVVYLIFSYLAGHVLLAKYLHITYVAGAGEVAVFCGAMVGACLGFLWFNAYPAQIFMGDTGSLSLGAALGGVAVITKQEILLVLVGGIFVLEALSVILQVGYFKISGGKRIFLMAPFHHHFEKKGWEEPKVVVRFWIVSIILGLLALATLKLR